MLREINASHANNTASHQFSNSQLTIRKMPPQEFLLSNIQDGMQGETDQRKVGRNTNASVLDNFIDYRA